MQFAGSTKPAAPSANNSVRPRGLDVELGQRQGAALLQLDLLRLNEFRFRPRLSRDDSDLDFCEEHSLRVRENAFVEGECASVFPLATQAPPQPELFVKWFEELRNVGPGQNDPLFLWLAEDATLDQMKWFLTQEVAGEAGFDDLVALTQVKMPASVKLEMARNYWDEMGQGNRLGMHGPLLDKLSTTLSIDSNRNDVVWESLALSNLMAALASNRHYAFHSVGSLGVVELTAPGRSKMVNAGLKRLGVDPSARKYFALHSTLDIEHSKAWNHEIILPLVSKDFRLARAIAEGALMRLRAGERCFLRYRKDLGLL